MLEFYEAYSDYRAFMDLTEELLRAAAPARSPAARVVKYRRARN